MARQADTPCALCGKLLWSSSTSLPAGQRTCQPCRRKGLTYIKREARGLNSERACPWCKQTFKPTDGRQRFCSFACRDAKLANNTHRFRTIKKDSTTNRGYGNDHSKARRAAATRHSPSDPCVRCGMQLGPMGPWLHYDHSDDRTHYLGFSCASCNVKAGAKRGAQVANAKTTPLRW